MLVEVKKKGRGGALMEGNYPCLISKKPDEEPRWKSDPQKGPSEGKVNGMGKKGENKKETARTTSPDGAETNRRKLRTP